MCVDLAQDFFFRISVPRVLNTPVTCISKIREREIFARIFEFVSCPRSDISERTLIFG